MTSLAHSLTRSLAVSAALALVGGLTSRSAAAACPSPYTSASCSVCSLDGGWNLSCDLVPGTDSVGGVLTVRTVSSGGGYVFEAYGNDASSSTAYFCCSLDIAAIGRSITVFGSDHGDTIDLQGVDDEGAYATDVQGNGGNDVIDGTANADAGGGGGVALFGGQGADTIRGRAGNDKMDGEDGADTLMGMTGDDTIYGSAGDDVCQGGPGEDLIESHEGQDQVDGGDGNDTILAGSQDDVVCGGSDGAGDYVEGSTGDDTLYVKDNAGCDIDGGPGTDACGPCTSQSACESTLSTYSCPL